jgi:hypothetical protein
MVGGGGYRRWGRRELVITLVHVTAQRRAGDGFMVKEELVEP